MIKKITNPKDTIGFVIRIELAYIEPAIWRQVAIPSDLTLEGLHHVIQIAMGWTDSHLHQFYHQNRYYGIPFEDFIDESDRLPEKDYTVDKFFKRKGSKLQYEYDFGDSWIHLIQCEKVIKGGDHAEPLKVLDGKRACPPEDCGSFPGYFNLLEIISDPDHEEYEEMIEWLGDEFDPEAFDKEEANKIFKKWKL